MFPTGTVIECFGVTLSMKLERKCDKEINVKSVLRRTLCWSKFYKSTLLKISIFNQSLFIHVDVRVNKFVSICPFFITKIDIGILFTHLLTSFTIAFVNKNVLKQVDNSEAST